MGRAPYHVAQRLLGWATDNWVAFDGSCAAAGVDPLALPPDRLLNLVWWRLAQNRDDQELAELQAWLEAEPPEALAARAAAAAAPGYDATGDGEAFLAALAGTGSRG